jgi:hypothetical protein
MFKKMLNATFNNIPVISWRPVLLVEEYSEKTTKMLIPVFCFARSQDVQKRKRYIKIVDAVKENGGEVRIFSSLHVSGERKFRNYISRGPS